MKTFSIYPIQLYENETYYINAVSKETKQFSNNKHNSCQSLLKCCITAAGYHSRTNTQRYNTVAFQGLGKAKIKGIPLKFGSSLCL